MVKKEILENVAKIVEKIVLEDKREDLEMIARILVQIEQTEDGKKLVGGMTMSLCASDKLRTEMKKLDSTLRPDDFAFDSDQNVKVKTEI